MTGPACTTGPAQAVGGPDVSGTLDATAPPAVTIGVITHPRRRDAFAKLLEYLATTIERYPGETRLCVGNNGGPAEGEAVRATVAASALDAVAPWRVVDSPENNIATGRNLVIDTVGTGLLAFIDDDEYPRPPWLSALVEAHHRLGAEIVAGPILPVYPPGTAAWVRGIDVHNERGRTTGETMDFVASGNFLIDLDALDACGGQRLDPAYGKSGGSDTEWFLRLGEAGLSIRWTSEAIVDEDIPADKATAAYALRRGLSQGANYRRILAGRDELGSPLAFGARALGVAALSGAVALPLVALGHPRAGDWVKRAASNLGKVRGPARALYR